MREGEAKCSVVLRPTDPLDNVATGVTDLPHARNSCLYDLSYVASFLGKVKDHPRQVSVSIA